MRTHREIVKVGLAAIIDNRLLVVRKHGSSVFILPGGKPEPGETQLDTLRREIEEELGCTISSTKYLRTFSDRAADATDTTVTVHLYSGYLCGDPTAGAEIQELDWVGLYEIPTHPLAPSIVNQILPYLRSQTWDDESGEAIRATA